MCIPRVFSVDQSLGCEGTEAHCGSKRYCQVRDPSVRRSTELICLAFREDDTNWPKKNIVGRQELEIRVGNDHISFEVSPFFFLQTLILIIWFLPVDC